MLTKKQVEEIKEHLERAQNPVFFFDNDPDGMCSFLLLQRYIERGKGVAIRTFPSLEVGYFRKVEELNADYIFIVDKPIVSQEFFDEVEKQNIPVVWIDHHETSQEIPAFVNYYNPTNNKKKTNEPVTALCYQITNRKQDLWLAVIGCISDKFIPEFYEEFEKEYPDLSTENVEVNDAFDILYNSKIGKVVKILDFGLKDSISNVVRMLKFLFGAKSPYEVLDEDNKKISLYTKYNEIDKKYQKVLNKAINGFDEGEKFLFFKYGGDLSVSSNLSNELSYLFPGKYIIIAYVNGTKVNISGRGKDVRKIILKAIEGFEDATGGGHEDAVGAKIYEKDLEMFRERVEGLI
ncbi:DHH family phosphoesterase [Candidatus Pacearchaeota archaeon]|nr:DHH family phosphoesterase [Candidatus Pacearchaeota archaeon]